MDINNKQNLIDNNQKPSELKEIINLDNDENEASNAENKEITEEVKQNIAIKEKNEKPEITFEKPQEEEAENIIKDENKKNDIDEASSEGASPIIKKAMEGISLLLNSYWIELMGSLSLIIYLLIIEILVLYGIKAAGSLIGTLDEKSESTFDNIMKLLNVAFNKIGFKWVTFITMSQHLSVGFLCLTTFTSIMKETKSIKKFYICNLIKVVLYYGFSVLILLILDKGIKSDINEILLKNKVDNQKLKDFLYSLVDKLVDMAGGVLATFNTFLEKVAFGTMYIFLFSEPKCLEGKKMIYFRLLALIPVIYVIVCLVLRALYNSGTLEISVFVLPALLGSKITIFMFFISTISIIKLKSLKYEVFDEEGEIQPKVFTKIGSRNFGIMGILELIIGLFLPSWSIYGIGGKYLLVLCAPIMTLYDYKKKYVLKFPCCKKGNMTLCFKIIFLIIGWFIVIIVAVLDIIEFIKSFGDILKDILTFLSENIDALVVIINMFF